MRPAVRRDFRGRAIDRFQAPDDNTWQLSRPAAEWPKETLHLQIGFEGGQAVSLDGQRVAGPALLQRLNKHFGQYGVGRHIYTGDVSIGLKGRIAFECPGIDGLMQAHKALEDLVNSKLQNQFRAQVAERWGELVYQGFFYEPHKVDLEAYLASSQSHVTGTVTLSTSGGALLATAVESPFIIQNQASVYAQSCDWSPAEALGFIKLTGQSATLVNHVRRAS